MKRSTLQRILSRDARQSNTPYQPYSPDELQHNNTSDDNEYNVDSIIQYETVTKNNKEYKIAYVIVPDYQISKNKEEVNMQKLMNNDYKGEGILYFKQCTRLNNGLTRIEVDNTDENEKVLKHIDMVHLVNRCKKAKRDYIARNKTSNDNAYGEDYLE